MVRYGLWSVLFLLPQNLCAQTFDVSLGLKVAKVPEALYAQVPPLPKDQGVLVEAVEPNSPAWRVGLRRYDIIVSADAARAQPDLNAVTDQLKRGKLAKLTIIRAGREMVLPLDANRRNTSQDADQSAPKGLMKPGGPPAVTIQLKPMDNGQLSLVLTYYAANSGKMESVAYDGSLEEIEKQIHNHARGQQLPDRLQDLLEVALKRVRTISKNQK